MKRLFTMLATLTATALVVSACSAPVEGPPPPPASTALEMTDGVTPVYSNTLAANANAQFSLDAADASDPLIVIELDQDLGLELLNSEGGQVVASSNSASYFATGSTGLAAVSDNSASDLTGSAIVTTAPCRGSCVVVAASSGTRYFRVTNSGATSVSYNIYLYDSIYTDTNEPGNNAIAGAVAYAPAATTNEGAIETVGDEDWWFVADETDIDFDAGGDVNIVLTIHNAAGTPLRGPFQGGATPQVFSGEYLRVASTSGRAGRGAAGYYYLTTATTTVPLASGNAD